MALFFCCELPYYLLVFYIIGTHLEPILTLEPILQKTIKACNH